MTGVHNAQVRIVWLIVVTSTVTVLGLPNVVIYQPDDIYQGYTERWNAPTNPGGFTSPAVPAELTTAIDRIGNEGAVFTNAYTASAMCAPSRLAILTGRYASRGAYPVAREVKAAGADSQTTVSVARCKLSDTDNDYNLAAALRSVGYRTGTNYLPVE